jgi:3-keto-5-aminohexanoate cleavage enzyme
MEYSKYIMDYKDGVEYEERIKRGTMPPLIISTAITGGIGGKELNPNLPETPEEQADSAYEVYKAGASLIHIHARDPAKGYAFPSSKPEHYHTINKLVRERCPDAIINNTTGGGPGLSTEERLAALDANPEVASLNCGPLIFKATLPARKPPLTGRDDPLCLDDWILPVTVRETEIFAKAMLDRSIKPEFEIYNPMQFNAVYNLIRQNLVKKPYWCSIIFSTYLGGIAVPGNIRNFVNILDNLPKDAMFQAIGVGQAQLPMIVLAMLTGGHIRVGMEDNIHYRRDQLLDSNAQMVKKVVRMAKELNRDIATAAQAREILDLSSTPSSY